MVGVTAVLLTVTGVMALKVEDAEDQMTRLAVSRDPYTSLPYPYTGPYKSEYEKYEKDGITYTDVYEYGVRVGNGVQEEGPLLWVKGWSGGIAARSGNA